MTNEEYDNLQEGDVIRPMDAYRPMFHVTTRAGNGRYDDIIAKPCEHTVFVDKAKEWQLVSKATPTPTPTPEDASSPNMAPSSTP